MKRNPSNGQRFRRSREWRDPSSLGAHPWGPCGCTPGETTRFLHWSTLTNSLSPSSLSGPPWQGDRGIVRLRAPLPLFADLLFLPKELTADVLANAICHLTSEERGTASYGVLATLVHKVWPRRLPGLLGQSLPHFILLVFGRSCTMCRRSWTPSHSISRRASFFRKRVASGSLCKPCSISFPAG